MINLSGFFKGIYEINGKEFEIKGFYYAILKHSIHYFPSIDLIKFNFNVIPDKLEDNLNRGSGYISLVNGKYPIGIVKRQIFEPIHNNFNDWLMKLITSTYLKNVEVKSNSYPFYNNIISNL
jgi:hypothetical protein